MHALTRLACTVSALTIVAFASGCSANAEPGTSSEDVTAGDSDLVATTFDFDPSPAALAFPRASWNLEGKERFGRYVYFTHTTGRVAANVEGVAPTGQVLVGQIVDIQNDGGAHQWSVVDTTRGVRLGSITLPPGVTTVQIRQAGAFELTCDDCEVPLIDVDAAKSWEELAADDMSLLRGWEKASPKRTVTVIDEVKRCEPSPFSTNDEAWATCSTEPAPDLL